MKFVNLTDYEPTGNEKVNIKHLESKQLNNKESYKLENVSGLIWCAKERKDEFYSEWESVQPKQCKYAVYYEPKSTTYTIKPKELFGISDELGKLIRGGNDPKETILEYIREKSHRKDIENIVCQIDDSLDVGDLHTLFNTADVSKVVEGYGKSFSAMFWNYIDERDESCFQVPSLMIMDSSCMNITEVLKTIPYQQRKSGIDKITGDRTNKINIDEILKLLNTDLNLDNAIELLKLKRDLKEPSIINAIETKLSTFKMLENAEKIMNQDELANQLYIVYSDDKETIKQQVLSDVQLQKQLEQKRLGMDNDIDIYMATYVEILEELNRNKFFKPLEKTREESEKTNKTKSKITSNDIERIPGIKNTEKTSIKDWFGKTFDRFKSMNGKEK